VREAADATKRIAVAQVRNAPKRGVYLNVSQCKSPMEKEVSVSLVHAHK
jgi:hypothetical protein